MKKVDMPWREIPGWRQDHLGRIYVTLINDRSDRRLPRSTDVRYLPAPTISPERARLYELVTVESKGYQAWLGIEPENDKQRRLKEEVMRRGPTYQTMRLFLERTL